MSCCWKPSRLRRRCNRRTTSQANETKALTGNPGKRRLNAPEPRPARASPECPAELSPPARQEWMRLTAELTKLNLITHLDGGALAGPEVWRHSEVADRLSDPVGVSLDCQQAGGLMMRVASEFGFTPASRSRISAPPPEQLSLLDPTSDECGEDSRGAD